MVCDQKIKSRGDQAFNREKKKDEDINDKQAFFNLSLLQYFYTIGRCKTTNDDTADDIGIKSNGSSVVYIQYIDHQKYHGISGNDPLDESRNLEEIPAVYFRKEHEPQKLA